MYGVDQPVKGLHGTAGELYLPTGEYFEGVDHWIHGPARIVVSVDQDRLMVTQLRSDELGAVSKGTPVRRVGRENMHYHVVIELAVVAHQPQHLDLDCPILSRWAAQADIARLTGAVPIRNTKPTRAVPERVGLGEVGHDQLDRLRLGMRSDPWLVRGPRTGANRYRCKRIDHLNRSRKVSH